MEWNDEGRRFKGVLRLAHLAQSDYFRRGKMKPWKVKDPRVVANVLVITLLKFVVTAFVLAHALKEASPLKAMADA